MDPQTAENHTSRLSTFLVVRKILTYKRPHRSVTAENATFATTDDLNQPTAGRGWMSISYRDTNPKRANEKAKDLIAEYEAENEDNKLVGGMRQDGTLWYIAVLSEGSERCEVQIVKR
ncbi:MAG: hypothetical protein Q9181_007619 [Wetmoreana brouardii]